MAHRVAVPRWVRIGGQRSPVKPNRSMRVEDNRRTRAAGPSSAQTPWDKRCKTRCAGNQSDRRPSWDRCRAAAFLARVRVLRRHIWPGPTASSAEVWRSKAERPLASTHPNAGKIVRVERQVGGRRWDVRSITSPALIGCRWLTALPLASLAERHGRECQHTPE